MPEHRRPEITDDVLLGAFAEIGAALTNPTSERPPLDVVADWAASIFGAKLVAVLGADDSDPGQMAFAALSGTYPPDAWAMRIPSSSTFTGEVSRSGRPRVEKDITTGSAESRSLASAFGARSGIFVPIERIGVMVVASAEPDAYDENDLDLAEVFADLASIAIDVASQSRLNEKERLAAELHDGATQLLYAALLQVDNALTGPLEDVVARLDDALNNVNEGIGELRLHSVEAAQATMSLFDRLNHLAAQLGRGRDVEVATSGSDLAPAHFAVPELARIALEATSNALRHSGTDRVRITLDCTGDWLRLAVQDWGEGFNVATQDRGLGLSNMPRRAEQIGADYSLESVPGAGTRVTVELPLS